MRKSAKAAAPRERVLARILAEDLENVGISGAGDTVNFTIESTGTKDITNIGWDADKPEN
jgi:hypothetical protein